MERICHKCKHTPGEDDLYCSVCGAKLPPRTLSHGTIILIIECIILIAVVLGGGSLLNHITSPKTTITKYYEGLTKGKYEQAYGRIAQQQDEFLTATDFVNAIKSYPYESLVVKEISLEGDKEEAYLKGKVVLQDLKNKHEYVESVNLIKTGSIGGLWPRWKVDSNLILEDYVIETPVETKIYLNDILLQRDNVKVEETQNAIRYTIPKVFAGKYRFRLESKVYVEFERVLDTKEDSDFKIEYLQLKPETKKLLEEKSKMDFEHLWQSIYTNQAYDQTKLPQNSTTSKEVYDNMGKNRVPHGYRNVEVVAYADYLFKEEFLVEEGVLKAKVTVDALRAFSGRYYYMAIIPTDKISRDTCVVNFIYVYNKGNGKWELESFTQ